MIEEESTQFNIKLPGYAEKFAQRFEQHGDDFVLRLRTYLSLWFPYQLEWWLLGGEFKYSIINKSRQIGISETTAARIAFEALILGEPWTIVSLRQDDARKILATVKSQLMTLIKIMGFGSIPYDTKDQLTVLVDGVETSVKATSTKAAGRGFTGSVMLDEYAYHDNAKAVLDACFAAVEHGGKLAVVSTPSHKETKYWELVEMATPFLDKARSKDFDKGWALFHVDVHRAIENGHKSFNIERAKAGCTKEEFDNWYLCLPRSTTEAVFDSDDINRCVTSSKPVTFKETVMGMDLGLNIDPTARVWLVEDEDGIYWVVSGDQGGDTGAQAWKEHVSSAYSAGADKVYMDSTGIGGPTAKDMRELYPGRFKGVHFSPETKAEMVGILSRLIDRKMIRFCSGTEKLQRQLPTVEKGMTPSGKVTYVSNRRFKSGHSDQAWALLIACMSIKGKLPDNLGVEKTGTVRTPYDEKKTKATPARRHFRVRVRSQGTRGI